MSICFLSDWKNADGNLRAIPHITTKNTSFLRHCQVLKRMGIANYAFPLALYDPDLKDVDVHDLEDNTPENEILRTKVLIEARRNGWYFLRECMRIYEQGGKPIPFRLDRGSCAMAWSFFNGIDYTGMQPRQTGKPQPVDSKVLTTEGWMRLGDVTFDTYVKTPDGGTSRVCGIFPKGILPIYRITLEDGRRVESCKEHSWPAYSDAWEEEYRVLTLEEIMTSQDVISLMVGEVDPNGSGLRKIKSIDYVGNKESMCILIDNPDHLYITDDYVITHNTVCALSVMAWILYCSGYEFQMGMLAKDNTLREDNVRRVKTFGENLPSWWIAEDKFKDKKNTSELYYHQLRTHYTSFVAQKDKGTADLQARGASPPVFHFDEFEFCVNINISYPTILASTGTARENAKKNGKPHSNIITSTAGDPSKPECKEAAKILEGAMPFTEHLYDVKDREELHAVVKSASPQKMLLGVFSHLQLGYDNEWLRDKITRNRMTRDQVMRDYLNRRVSIQETPVIPKETLALITASEMDPKHIQILNGRFTIYWYLPKEVVEAPSFKHRTIIVGADSSEMIGRDATTLVGIDPRDLSVVFTFRANEGNLNVVGAMIAQLLLMYPGMVFVPENKSSGTGFIDTVSLLLRKEGHNPFSRIFNWIVNNYHEAEFAKYNIRDTSLLDTQAKRFFGIKTDKTKRDELYSSTLLTAAAKAPSRIRDRVLIQELNALIVKNGRVDHETGSHDDTCFIGSTMIRTDNGNRPISELKVGDLVLTRQGYKPILGIFSREKEVITRFNLTGTPDHPFITPDGIVPFESLTNDSKVYVWNEKQLCIEEKAIIDTLIQRDLNIENTSTATTKTTNHLWPFIVRYGKIITALYQRAMKSTTTIMTSQTMSLTTSNASLPKLIEESIPFLKRPLEQMESGQRSRTLLVDGEKRIQKQQESMRLETVRTVQGYQIGDEITLTLTDPCVPKTESALRRRIRKMEQLVRASLNGDRKTQRRRAPYTEKPRERPLRPEEPMDRSLDQGSHSQTGEEITQKKLDDGHLKQVRNQPQQEPRRELVYNLHVAECHEYFVNDILVHNCIAWLMAVWFILNAKNLNLYGIKPGTIMSVVDEGDDASVKRNQERQEEIRKRIEVLEKSLRTETDPTFKQVIKSDLELYRSIVDTTQVPTQIIADDLHRDPRRFIDQKIAQESRTPVSADQVESSLRQLLRI